MWKIDQWEVEKQTSKNQTDLVNELFKKNVNNML